ncbi:hypothetical protein MCUN1_003645 [Malassezia cuniculi]|uniref:Uncharacterized protein n=1 Tax=Malassezia cuniculi TaxID=948313 RepID=A0AAF0F1Z3_9BASI|nr:hypothetical protein MCUN1_003645 [Malassezia cuniculi]
MKLAELRLSSSLHGWDPWRILAQIALVQVSHYVLLATFVPPLLAIFTAPKALRFEGGPAQVGMLLDWRELASQPTWEWTPLLQIVFPTGPLTNQTLIAPSEKDAFEKWSAGSVWLHGAQPIVVPADKFAWKGELTQNSTADSSTDSQEKKLEQWEWKLTHDASRGWAIAFAWLMTVPFDVQVLYYLVRKPTHMLDFVSTMHLLHFGVTSLYAKALPVSIFWWLVMFVHGSACIVFSERLAIQREMRVGFTEHEELEAIELASTPRP